MTPGTPSDVAHAQLDTLAWRFLESEFTGPIYADWPIDRRIDVFLRRHGLGALGDDGSAYEALVERVMANMGKARRSGTLPPARDQVRT